MYKVKDNYDGTLKYLSNEKEIIDFAGYYAERMNDEKEDGEKDIIIKDFKHAVEVLESANVYVEKV